MPHQQSMPRWVMSVGGFAVRHCLAMFVVVASACILWTIVYFALLLWAVLAGGGIGGPLAYPVGLLLVVVAATLAAVALLFPAAALAEWIARFFRLPIVVQIPMSVVLLAALCFTVGLLARAFEHPHFAPGRFFWAASFIFLVHLVPLGVYWWAAQSGPLLLSLIRKFLPDSRAQNT